MDPLAKGRSLLMVASTRSKGGNTRLWLKIRERILMRDGYACQQCGNDERSQLTVDHQIPISRGGDDSELNLLTLCKKCNFSKGSKLGGFFGTPRKPLTLPFLDSQENESTSHD